MRLCVGRENFIENGELIYKTEEEPCPTAQKTGGERKSKGNVFKAGDEMLLKARWYKKAEKVFWEHGRFYKAF